MKKILLTILTIATCSAAYSQVVCAGVSPASIQGNYDYGVQVACGQWPGEVDDATWGTWAGLDFNNPGDFIQGELMLVEDGTPGTNPQGNPISQEGCNTLTNNLSGKIAIVYRNTCWFSTKVFYAQEAGAIGVIVVNREAGIIGMLGNTDIQNGPLGADCHIPAVFLDKTDGEALIAEMGNGPVTMFIGNKLGAYANDVGAVKGEYLVSPFGGAHNLLFDGFEPGIQVYNFGSADQTDVVINATIDGPGGNVYDETVGPLALLSGDTVSVFPGNTDFFPAWQLGIGNYTDGDYTLTYTISITGTPDESSFDNVYTSDFKIQDEHISLSRLNLANMPVSNSYPSNSTSEYQSCMMFQDANASALAIQGMYFTPHTDTAANELAGAEIFANVYQWDDGWVDLDDPNYQFDPATNDAFQNLNLITFGTHYPASNDDVDDIAYVGFNTPFGMVDNQRYLFCLQTFESATISFGYDSGISYDGNEGIFRQPTSPVHIDGQWYTGGWSGSSATSIALKTFDPAELGLIEEGHLIGNAFPNPSTGVVTVSIDASGDANISVTDIAGKVAMNSNVTFNNGLTKVDMSSLESGVYIFNITLENGQTSQFNVIKK